MKKTLLMSMLIALSSYAMQANDTTYIEKADTSKISAIKTDSACQGQSCGCSGELEEQRLISLTAASYENCMKNKEKSNQEAILRDYYIGKADHSKIGAIKN